MYVYVFIAVYDDDRRVRDVIKAENKREALIIAQRTHPNAIIRNLHVV